MIKTFRRTVSNDAVRGKPKQRTHATSYANRKWRSLCVQWLQQYPVCVVCACQGRYNQGLIEHYLTSQRNLVVDHIEPHRGDENLFWDADNLETLCRTPCHDCYKQSHERRNTTVGAWFDWLRSQMQLYQAELHIQSLRRWIPDRIARELI